MVFIPTHMIKLVHHMGIIMVNGKMINCMAKDNSSLKMDLTIKELLKII